MDLRASSTLRMILHAAARVLACGSAQMALLDPERDALVIRVAVRNDDEARFHAVESLLGFATDGLAMPLSNEDSVLVRAAREGRIVVTGRFADVAGLAIPGETATEVEKVIGAQTYAAVPVPGRAGVIGVILFVKAGDAGFAASDRDLLLAYADRVGAALESGELDREVSVLSSLGDPGLPQPAIHLCDESLRLVEGEGHGQPLARVLRAEGSRTQLLEAARAPGEGTRSLTLRTDDGRTVRVALRPAPPSPGSAPIPGPSAGSMSGSIARPGALRFVVVVEDLGWVARLTREAARAREHVERVLGASGGVVLTLDPLFTIAAVTGDPRGLFDASGSSLLGRPLHESVADARARRRLGLLGRRLADAGFAEGELPLARGGRPVIASVSALLLADERGQPTGSLWRLVDLTARRRGDAERKRLRARLLRSERLSALGQMAARIAHEVRNPLVSIGAAAQVVLEELPDGAPARAEVVAIAREVRRLDGILTGFLQVSRPSGIATSAAPRVVVDVAQLVTETTALLGARGGARVRLARTDDEAAATSARCDADGVRQVLWNLLTNAVEASPEGGVVECDVRARGDRVLVTIADEGPGISRELRRRLFDPFFSTKARGTGLGLAISRQIVEDHHGRLRLVRRRPHGTVVTVELPRAIDGEPAERALDRPRGRRRVAAR